MAQPAVCVESKVSSLLFECGTNAVLEKGVLYRCATFTVPVVVTSLAAFSLWAQYHCQYRRSVLSVLSISILWAASLVLSFCLVSKSQIIPVMSGLEEQCFLGSKIAKSADFWPPLFLNTEKPVISLPIHVHIIVDVFFFGVGDPS